MARVEDGSILLGLPGAPGCTTAGFVESDCCECATTQKNPVEANSKLQNIFRIDEKYVGDSTRCWSPHRSRHPAPMKSLAVSEAGSLTAPQVHCYDRSAGWSSLVARWAHNPKFGGSNPPPATKSFLRQCLEFPVQPGRINSHWMLVSKIHSYLEWPASSPASAWK